MSDITLGAITIPGDMEWTDEFTGWKRGQDVQTAVQGSLIVQEASRQAGRPITLTSGNSGNEWWGVVSYETVLALQALVDAGGTHTLVIPRYPDIMQEFIVRFDQSDPIEARPLKFIAPAAPTDDWFVRLSLFTV